MRKTSIKAEITPAHLRCCPASCPSVYVLSDGDLLIIGKKISEDLHKDIEGKVAADEFAIRISPEFFQHLPRNSGE